MSPVKKYIGNLFLTSRFYLAIGLCIVLFIVSFFYKPFMQLPKTLLAVSTVLILIDYLFLFIVSKSPTAKRLTADRLSNGDENKIELQVINRMPFTVTMEIIDELPVQFQKRDWKLNYRFAANEQKNIIYKLRPVERGEYHFGNIILYVKSLLGLLNAPA